MKKFLSVIAIALSLVACKKDNTVLHGLTSMGDLVGNSLYTDEGLVLTITKASCKEGYDVNERLYFYCDLLKELAPNKYEIELKDWVRVLRKNVILSSAIEDDEALGHEPIHLGSAWYAGGYLNMNVGIMYKKDSETKHILNLVLMQDQSDDNNLVFSLCFDTPALDDTGIPHILEHCVLCGSESYPFKDAFNFLENNTLHSYLNAITYPDKTLYPVASTDEGSLMLMARVYCDAVFHPLVYKNKGIFLQEGGFAVRLSRPTPTTQLGTSNASSLAARVDDANDWGADWFLSLHANASDNSAASGCEAFVFSPASRALPLAEEILAGLARETGLRDRGVSARPGLYVLRRTRMPAALVELGFITNPSDAALMNEEPERFARGIAAGVFRFFGLD